MVLFGIAGVLVLEPLRGAGLDQALEVGQPAGLLCVLLFRGDEEEMLPGRGAVEHGPGVLQPLELVPVLAGAQGDGRPEGVRAAG